MHRENDKIERYKTYLRLEKALSANSIDAYLTDLDKLTNFVESEGKKYADVTYDDLQQFVARLHDIGIHPRSQARIISGIKSFYRFLFLDGAKVYSYGGIETMTPEAIEEVYKMHVHIIEYMDIPVIVPFPDVKV